MLCKCISDFIWLHIPNGHKTGWWLQPLCLSSLSRHSKHTVKGFSSHLSFFFSLQRKLFSFWFHPFLYNSRWKDTKEGSLGQEEREDNIFAGLGRTIAVMFIIKRKDIFLNLYTNNDKVRATLLHYVCAGDPGNQRCRNVSFQTFVPSERFRNHREKKCLLDVEM